jgi:hypothetical protein
MVIKVLLSAVFLILIGSKLYASSTLIERFLTEPTIINNKSKIYTRKDKGIVSQIDDKSVAFHNINNKLKESDVSSVGLVADSNAMVNWNQDKEVSSAIGLCYIIQQLETGGLENFFVKNPDMPHWQCWSLDKAVSYLKEHGVSTAFGYYGITMDTAITTMLWYNNLINKEFTDLDDEIVSTINAAAAIVSDKYGIPSSQSKMTLTSLFIKANRLSKSNHNIRSSFYDLYSGMVTHTNYSAYAIHYIGNPDGNLDAMTIARINSVVSKYTKASDDNNSNNT